MAKMHWDAIWINARIVPCTINSQMIERGAIAVTNGNIAWIGHMAELPAAAEVLADTVYDLNGACLTPGLIDCHTHLVYANNRAHEFEQRLHGATYEEIARAGGGILSTVKATRAATEEELFAQSIVRARALMKNGATTIEIKSGYGLDFATEMKMLRVAKKIAAVLPVTIKTTFLGAHTIAPEYLGRANDYLDIVCHEMIPYVAEHRLADAVDVFCEKIAFDLAQTDRVFDAAKKHGLAVKCHAEQLSDSGAATLAASYQALSADHLEHATLATIKAMAASGTVAVLLPGAFYFLRETVLPPIALLREYGVAIAIASDCNPGTSPIMSLPTIMNMACTLYRMTPTEALLGVTKQAARALGMHDVIGTLEVGKAADFAIWEVVDPCELAYYIGWQPCQQLVKGGVLIG